MTNFGQRADRTGRYRSLLLAFVLMVGIALGSLTCAAGMASADSHTATGHDTRHESQHGSQREGHHGVEQSGHESSQQQPESQPMQHPAEHHAGMSCLVAFHFSIEVAHTATACSDLADEAPSDPTGRAERPEPPVPKHLLTSH